MSRMIFVTHALRERLRWSPALTQLGLLGMALGALCVAATLLHGQEIPPEGNLLDTASFNGAVGFFILTLTVLASGVSWKPLGKRVWVGWLVGLTLYAYVIETMQAFRGLDPRFSRIAGTADQIAGGVFFLAAVGIMVCFIIVAMKYFRLPPTPVSVAVRYGAATCMLAFGVGILMSAVTEGRHVPEEGNLLFLHAAGFHGLQTIPLLALLLRWANVPDVVAMRQVHVAGFAWLGACAAIALQSFSGQTLLEVSTGTVAAGVFLLTWLLAFSASAAAWVRSGASAHA